MGLKGLVTQRATDTGFRYVAGADAGNFVDLLTSKYLRGLVARAEWLADNVLSLSESEFDDLVSSRLESVLYGSPAEEREVR